MYEPDIKYNLELCSHGNPKGICDICDAENLKKTKDIIEKAPDGWMTNGGLAKKYSKDFVTIKNIANQYRETNPQWFKQYRDRMGQVREHYASELVVIIEKKLNSRELALPNWASIEEIRKKIKRDRSVVTRLIKKYQKIHPEWFKKYISPGKKFIQYCAPEFVKAVEEEVGQYKPAPDSWMTTGGIEKKHSKDYQRIKRIAEEYRQTHPEWFRVYRSLNGMNTEHYAPELVAIIEKELNQYEIAPDGWMTNGGVARKISKTKQSVKKIADRYLQTHPEWFRTYRSRNGIDAKYYAPELVAIIEKESNQYESAPEGWMTNEGLARKIFKNSKLIKNIANQYRKSNQQWFKQYRNRMGQVREHYAPELVDIIKNGFAPNDWLNTTEIAKKFNVSKFLIESIFIKYSELYNDLVKKYVDESNKSRNYYAPKLVNVIKEELDKYQLAPEGWLTNGGLTKKHSKNFVTIKNIANQYRETNPQWFQQYRNKIGQVREHYAPELVAIIEKKLNEHSLAPDGWFTNKAISKKFRRAQATITNIADQYRESNPQWFKQYLSRGRLREHYAPELITIIQQSFDLKNNLQYKQEQEKFLKNDLENKLSEIESGIDDAQLKEIINSFDGAVAIDILFHFYPEFKGLPVDYVKSKLAEYLGDFLVHRGELDLRVLNNNVEMLSMATVEDSVFEVLKREYLSFYNKQKIKDRDKSDREIFDTYIEFLIEQMGDIKSEHLDNIIERVEEYYDDLLNQKKPDNIVGALREGRIFPDLNQLVNIKEIKDKNRMLIADEMGLGKSASAILTKEYLGCSCALVVVPSNVVETWKKYLSSDIDPETGKQKGYFKKGLEPRVLIVESKVDIAKIQNEVWDYVIVSHEKLNSTYMDVLSELGNNMLIVDEVHKMKNTKGARANNLLTLARQVEEDDQYLTLLSGTPVPNKINDLAMVLKLLYPEEFSVEQTNDKELVQNIIKGELLDIRSLLVPRMQMKNIRDSIEMPELNEELSYVEMSQQERDIYEVLLEEDEIMASQKMQVLRQFLLNPAMLDSTPNIHSSKIERLSNKLQEAFETKEKIIVFVNSYVENLIRGKSGIQRQLEEQLDNVEIFAIHGKDGEESDLEKDDYRKMVQDKFNNGNGKILLLVSGATADVGVDFSGGQKVFFYNEPWTMYDKRQQLARVFREGIENDLDVDTSIVRDTIEEGIYKYIRIKEAAIEKLLRGIPITKLEQRRLREDEQVDMSKEVNEEIAEYYFSAWDKLMKIFGHTKEIGEKDFLEFLIKHGEEYAECYIDLGARSYQANASRINANIIDSLAQDNNISDLRILDIASGPEILKKHAFEQYQDRIFSIDINKHHFAHKGENRMLGSFLNLPIQSESMDFVNFSFAIHYSKMLLTEKNFERVEVFAEINRVLKEGGHAVVNFVHSMDFKNKEQFLKNIEKMGFEVVSGYTGNVDGKENYQSFILTIKKKDDFEQNVDEFIDKIGIEDAKGFKFIKNKKIKLKDSRMLVSGVKFNGREIPIKFNTKDAEIYEEEQYILKQAEILRSGKKIEDIERQKIIDKKFVRTYNGKRYILFKKLEIGNGAVVVR